MIPGLTFFPGRFACRLPEPEALSILVRRTQGDEYRSLRLEQQHGHCFSFQHGLNDLLQLSKTGNLPAIHHQHHVARIDTRRRCRSFVDFFNPHTFVIRELQFFLSSAVSSENTSPSLLLLAASVRLPQVVPAPLPTAVRRYARSVRFPFHFSAPSAWRPLHGHGPHQWRQLRRVAQQLIIEHQDDITDPQTAFGCR